MKARYKWRIVLLLFLFLTGYKAFSQHTSKSDYTGAWETSTSWIPTWAVPQTTNINNNITIYGLITRNGSLTVNNYNVNLIVSDTLVIIGNLTIGHFDHLTVSDSGILIIRGNLILDDDAIIDANGYLIVTGDIHKIGGTSHQYMRSNDNPVKVFIGGSIDAAFLNKTWNPILECTTQPSLPYPNSGCSYGNITDLVNDPIYPFYQTTCTIASPAITAGGPTTFCTGDSVILTSSIGNTYLWSTGATSSSIIAASSGSYTVKVKNRDECLSLSSATSVITVNDLPLKPAITAGGPTTFCTGMKVGLSSSQGVSYLWSTGDTIQKITTDSSGIFTLRVSNANKCISPESEPITILVNPLPPTPTIFASGPLTFCAGDSVSLTSSKSFSYLWSTGSANAVINLAVAGSFSVRVTDINGCTSMVSGAVVINVNSLPVVNAGADFSIPNGTSTKLNAIISGDGPFNLNWKPSAQLIKNTIEDPTTKNLNINTIFILTATSITSLCSNTDTVIITLSGDALKSVPVANSYIACAGDSTNLFAFASGGSGKYTYTWSSIPAGFTSRLADPIAIPMVNTTYKLVVFDGFSTFNSQVIVTAKALPDMPTISVSGPKTFCAGGNVQLKSSEAASYLWSNGDTTQSINADSSANYAVIVTNQDGCKSTESEPAKIIVNPLPAPPTITAEGPGTFCIGASVILDCSAGVEYFWSDSSATSSIKVTSHGKYSVRITNENGCISPAAVDFIINVNPLPIVKITSSDSSMCVNDLKTLTGSPAGGIFKISEGEGNIAGNILTVLGAGKILLEYNYSDVCANKYLQSIIVNGNPEANAGPDQELQFIFESSMQAELYSADRSEWSVISGTGHISDIHSPTTLVTNLSLGENLFQWKLWNGACEAKSQVKITIADLFVPSVITPDGNGRNDIFKLADNIGIVELIIFNRWGNEEYINNNYSNDWDGRNNKGIQLPNDTYFYLLKFENGQIRKGALLIKR